MEDNTQVKTYASEESAQRRVEQLNRLGYWPGIKQRGDRFVLTHDPDTAGQRRHTATEGQSG